MLFDIIQECINDPDDKWRSRNWRCFDFRPSHQLVVTSTGFVSIDAEFDLATPICTNHAPRAERKKGLGKCGTENLQSAASRPKVDMPAATKGRSSAFFSSALLCQTSLPRAIGRFCRHP